MAELPVAVGAPDSEVNISIQFIGMAFLNQSLHHPDDIRYLVGGSGINTSPLYIQGIHILEVLVDEPLSQLLSRDAERVCPGDDLIVNIGEVLHMSDLVAAEFEIAAHDIEDDVAHGMADMARVVGRYPADVHLDLDAIRGEFLFLT